MGQFASEMAAIFAQEQVPPWCSYVARRDGIPVGFGGFTGPPDTAGDVEIGYLTFPDHAGTGVASAFAARLILIARKSGATGVIAHTLPEENASTSVLRANGFSRDGEGIDTDEGVVWRWRLTG